MGETCRRFLQRNICKLYKRDWYYVLLVIFGSIFDVFFSFCTPFDLDGSRCHNRVLEDMIRMMALVKMDEDEEGHEGWRRINNSWWTINGRTSILYVPGEQVRTSPSPIGSPWRVVLQPRPPRKCRWWSAGCCVSGSGVTPCHAPRPQIPWDVK